MATAPTAPAASANVLLRLLSPSPSTNMAISNQQQQEKTPWFLSLSLSPASRVVVKKKGKTKRMLLDGAFQCRTCGRRFATFQALGGHRTSHKRPRVRADGLDLLLGACPAGKGAAAKHVHRCLTCGTVFPTGQALGGHMHRHRATTGTETTTVGLSDEVDGENDEGQPRRTLIQFI